MILDFAGLDVRNGHPRIERGEGRRQRGGGVALNDYEVRPKLAERGLESLERSARECLERL